MKKVVIGVVIAVVVIGGGLLLLNSTQKKSDTTAGTQSSQQQTTNAPDTITYSTNGFSPASLTVKSGTTVTIVNNAGSGLQFDSDPHPDHTDNTELNVGLISAGERKTFVVTKTGTFGYHNHLNASDRGTIEVQ